MSNRKALPERMIQAAILLEELGKEYGYPFPGNCSWTANQLRTEAERLAQPAPCHWCGVPGDYGACLDRAIAERNARG